MKLALTKLKIKSKHLALEPSIIRKEEKKLTGYARASLYLHRIQDVRNEARATQLAIAFLKGKDYKKVEPNIKEPHHYKHSYVKGRVVSMVRKYGRIKDAQEKVEAWFNYKGE